jgi:TRAP-type C4-dicarboxylate transport system permease small subunit
VSTRIGKGLDKVIAFLDHTSRVAVWIGGGLLIASAFVIGAEVLLRRLGGVTTRGADEFSYYVLAISTSWAFSFALLRKAHIRVDALYVLLPSSLKAALDVLALLSLAVFSSIASYVVLFGTLSRSITRGTASNTAWQIPLWIPQGLWFLGLALFSVTVVVLLIRIVWALIVERDFQVVERYAGSQTLESEIEEALSDKEVAKLEGTS